MTINDIPKLDDQLLSEIDGRIAICRELLNESKLSLDVVKALDKLFTLIIGLKNQILSERLTAEKETAGTVNVWADELRTTLLELRKAQNELKVVSTELSAAQETIEKLSIERKQLIKSVLSQSQDYKNFISAEQETIRKMADLFFQHNDSCPLNCMCSLEDELKKLAQKTLEKK